MVSACLETSELQSKNSVPKACQGGARSVPRVCGCAKGVPKSVPGVCQTMCQRCAKVWSALSGFWRILTLDKLRMSGIM